MAAQWAMFVCAILMMLTPFAVRLCFEEQGWRPLVLVAICGAGWIAPEWLTP